jgi:ADP-heptose:LPS heptosyltransferase
MRAAIFVQNRDFWGAKLIHAPLFHAARERWPGCTLAALVPYPGADFFVKEGLADEAYTYAGFSDTLSLLKRQRYDAVISLRPEAAWLNLALALAPAGLKIGFRSPLSFLFQASPRGAYSKRLYRAYEFKSLLDASTGLDGWLSGVPPAGLPPGRNVFVLPGGGAGDFKRWPLENFLEVCRALPDDCNFWFVLGEQEKKYRPAVEKFAAERPARALFGLPALELASYFKSGDLFLANDCGPFHLAQMLDRPAVLVLSDEQRGAARIAAEWFRPGPARRAVTGAAGAAISAIKPAAVLAAIRETGFTL